MKTVSNFLLIYLNKKSQYEYKKKNYLNVSIK